MNKKFIIPSIIVFLILISFFLFLIYKSINTKQISEIAFRITWDELSSRGIAVRNIVEEYNESQNKFHVTMVGGNETREDYIMELEQDNIDVFMVPYRYIKDSAISDKFMELSDWGAENEDYFYDAIQPLTRSKNGVVGIPWIGHSMALIYNKGLIEQAGIDPESLKSMQDLLNACKQITQKTDAYGLGLVGANSHDLSWMVSQFVYSFGGSLVETDSEGNQTSILINSPESAQALDFYINELGKYAQEGWQTHTGGDVMEVFADEKIAFEIQGPWGITDIWKRGNQFEVGAIPLSQLNMYSEVGPLMLSISRNSKSIDGAKDFILYLTNKKTLEKIMDGEYDEKYQAYYPYRVPLRKDMEDSTFFKKYPEFLVFIEGYEKSSINTPTEEWEEEYKNIYEYYIHEVIIGNITISQALENIENKKPK